MNFEEHAAKPLLEAVGIPVPPGRIAATPDEAAAAAAALGAVVVKAQVPTGRRGKAAGILPADDAEAARAAAGRILDMSIGEHRVTRVLVERRAAIAREVYAAIMNDPSSKGPLVLVSSCGGMDIEEVTRANPQSLRRAEVDIRRGFDRDAALAMLGDFELGGATAAVADVLAKMYEAYRRFDAELLEINPLALGQDGEAVALDCKFVMDDSGVARQGDTASAGTPECLTSIETEAKEIGLRYIELDGTVGVLANGAGLAMTTMDVIAHHGGAPANFLEIGGEAYTKAKPALSLVLANPRVQSLVVNFCGAFARTDVMTEGVIDAWQELSPEIPLFFSIHGTGAADARTMLEARLGLETYPTMDDAIVAAIAAAGSPPPEAGG